jgi:hypothetical protein
MKCRSGFALVLSLVLTVAMAVLGAGMLVVAARETEIAAAVVQGRRGQALAETAVRVLVADWSTRVYGPLAVGETAAVPGEPAAGVRAWVTRLGTTLFLVEAAAGAGVGQPAAAALVRALDAAAMAAAVPGAVVADSAVWLHAGMVSGLGSCGDAPDAAAVVAPLVDVAPGAELEGAPAVVAALPPDFPAPEALTEPLLSRLATVRLPPGELADWPDPGTGACATGAGVAAGDSTGSDCWPPPFIHVPGDLQVRSGEGQGLLLVAGDLQLLGFRFEGLVLATGRLALDSGTVIVGAARAATVEVRDARVTFDACAVRRAFGAGGLDGAFRPGHRWWIPRF